MIANLNKIDKTFDVLYTSSHEFYGFQFDVSGVGVSAVSGAAQRDIRYATRSSSSMTRTQSAY